MNLAAVRHRQLYRRLAHRHVAAVDRSDPRRAARMFRAPCTRVVLLHVAARTR